MSLAAAVIDERAVSMASIVDGGSAVGGQLS
jgi:hypothetical protein